MVLFVDDRPLRPHPRDWFGLFRGAGDVIGLVTQLQSECPGYSDDSDSVGRPKVHQVFLHNLKSIPKSVTRRKRGLSPSEGMVVVAKGPALYRQPDAESSDARTKIVSRLAELLDEEPCP